MTDPIKRLNELEKLLKTLITKVDNLSKKLDMVEHRVNVLEQGKTKPSVKRQSKTASTTEQRKPIPQTSKLIRSSVGYRDLTTGNGPFCTVCYDNGGKTVNLIKLKPTPENKQWTHYCGVCKNYFFQESYNNNSW